MNRLLIRIVLPLLIVAAGWRVLQQFRAAQIARNQPTTEGLRKAIQLDPEGSGYYFLLGIAHRDLPELQNPHKARAHLENAVALNPYNWRYQRELAQLYELSGETRDAEEAFLRAVELSPKSGIYRWRLANFYLRNLSLDKAVPHLEQALAADRGLLEPAFGLLLGAGGSYRQIDRVWPKDQEARRLLLRLVCLRQPSPGEPPRRGASAMSSSEDFPRQLWDRLLAGREPVPLADGQVYIDLLLKERRFEEARLRWIEITSNNGIPDTQFELGHNLIWNGDFERPITQTGFGWKVRDADGYTAALVKGEGFDGSGSLRITFDGSRNMSLSGIQQRVFVEPGRPYRLSFRARTQNLSTDQGVFFEVQDGPSRGQIPTARRLLGSTPWTNYSSAIVPQSPWIHVLLRRDTSLRFDNRLHGVLWIDSVRLELSSS